MKRLLLLTCLALTAMTRSLLLAQPPPLPPVEPDVVPLWPDESPNNPAEGPRPQLEIYRPFAPARPIPATIVILPGGGFRLLSPFERVMAEYFRSLGYTAVVVTYRVQPHLYPAAVADCLRAVRLVRQHASTWQIPERIALFGGSAGGYLAAFVATRPEFYRDAADDLAGRISPRPDRLILLYPAISAAELFRIAAFDHWLGNAANQALRENLSLERHVTADNPPVILFHAADDKTVIPDHSIEFARACWTAGVPAELHVFARGGHGRVFAYDAEVSPRWRALLQQWLETWSE